MSLRVVVHPAALRELGDAIERYDLGGQGRGARFRTDFDWVVDRCLEWPESAAEVVVPGSEQVLRHARVPHSRYRIVYCITGDVLKVLAIAHERRMPLYWANRD